MIKVRLGEEKVEQERLEREEAEREMGEKLSIMVQEWWQHLQATHIQIPLPAITHVVEDNVPKVGKAQEEVAGPRKEEVVELATKVRAT